MAVLTDHLRVDSGFEVKGPVFGNSTGILLVKSAPIITRSAPMVLIIQRMSSPIHQEVSR